MLETGAKVPDVGASDQDGNDVRLRGFAGRTLVGYFYPKADTSSQVCDAFGVIVEKNMYGKKSIGIQRSTFLAGPGGTIVKVWPRVSVEGHAAAVLEAVRSL